MNELGPYHTMRYFGRNLGAPIYREAEQVDAPVGVPCFRCEERIEYGDEGFIDVGGSVSHRACFLRGILGSVAHVLGRCTCCKPGSTYHDPPFLSRRQSAELAVWLDEMMRGVTQ
jgi:hypothetical protein